MQKNLLLVFTIILLISCKDKGSKKEILLDSSGNINNVSVVLDNELWDGSVGDAIRSVLAAPI